MADQPGGSDIAAPANDGRRARAVPSDGLSVPPGVQALAAMLVEAWGG